MDSKLIGINDTILRRRYDDAKGIIDGKIKIKNIYRLSEEKFEREKEKMLKDAVIIIEQIGKELEDRMENRKDRNIKRAINNRHYQRNYKFEVRSGFRTVAHKGPNTRGITAHRAAMNSIMEEDELAAVEAQEKKFQDGLKEIAHLEKLAAEFQQKKDTEDKLREEAAAKLTTENPFQQEWEEMEAMPNGVQKLIIKARLITKMKGHNS